tara:strand:+ start:538 stop:747 length:210 start_codon:yes stop_codon:yes gene_type:complete
MRFYYITWVDYEGMNRCKLFRNKKEAVKALTELKREEEADGASYLSDIYTIVLEKPNKDSIVEFVNQIA